MKKLVALAFVLILAFSMLTGCVTEQGLNSGTEDVLYNEIVYKRSDDFSINLEISEENAKYVGVYLETYAYGQEVPWDVYALNDDENILYTAYTVWLRPGYEPPEEFGEEFASVEYVVPDGINFLVIEDDYTEEVTPLTTFSTSVKLEDIVESEPTDLEDFTEHDILRFTYKNHSDIFLTLTLCSADGKYYLDVCDGETYTDYFHEIKPEYVELLTSAIEKAE